MGDARRQRSSREDKQIMKDAARDAVASAQNRINKLEEEKIAVYKELKNADAQRAAALKDLALVKDEATQLQEEKKQLGEAKDAAEAKAKKAEEAKDTAEAKAKQAEEMSEPNQACQGPFQAPPHRKVRRTPEMRVQQNQEAKTDRAMTGDFWTRSLHDLWDFIDHHI